MFQTLTGYIGAASMLLMGVLAFAVGGKPEKIGAGSYIFAWIATLVVRSSAPVEGVQWGTFAVDTALLVIFARLVWKSGRAWPVWACALQLLTVASHIMLIARLPTPISSFYTVVNLTGYGILVAIGFGIFWAWQDRRMLEMTELKEGPRFR